MYTEYEMPESMIQDLIEFEKQNESNVNYKKKGKRLNNSKDNQEMFGHPVKESLQHWINCLKDDWTQNE